MPDSTLLFVHGTGVRHEGYLVSIETIRAQVEAFKIPCRVDECLWGDALGVDFEGLSLPRLPELTPEEDAQAARWEYLQIDPLFDLKLWCTPAAEGSTRNPLGAAPRKQDVWAEQVWDKAIRKYPPTDGLKAILDRYHLGGLFTPAWQAVMNSGVPEKAFKTAGSEAAAVARAFAESVVAQMMHDGASAHPPETLPLNVRTKLVDRLLYDWKMVEKGVKDLLQKVLGAATKTVVRPMRSRASRAIAPAIGDILRYQIISDQLRALIRSKIEKLGDSVFLCSHSLGGIACFELMVEAKPGSLKGLITAGSQSPLLYEFDALKTLEGQKKLPDNFPWLNIYDENDLLSYCADRVFNRQVDVKVDSLLPPFEAHSAYWKLDETWKAIHAFVMKHR